MNDLDTKRRYSITGYEPSSEDCYTPFSMVVGLAQIISDEFEVYLAILDDFDALLDLEVGGKIVTRADRSDPFSSQTITRIK